MNDEQLNKLSEKAQLEFIAPALEPFNTLVQAETEKRAIILSGKGSDINNQKGIKGRAKRKMITQKTVYALIDVAKKKGDNDRVKGYWNAYHCQNRIYSSGDKVYGTYCKNRFCTLCCSIRKADIINRYLPIISTWSDPYFVTLTANALKKERLAKRIRDLNGGFKIITSRYRKRAQRGKGHRLMGIKSIECNFNPLKKTYNPHMHLIVADKSMAEIIINEWLKLFTKRFANPEAQHMHPITNKENALIEILKYGCKIFTEPNPFGKSNKRNDPTIYAVALDNIFTAIKGCRVFERFGFNLPKKKKETSSNLVTNYEEWEFDPKKFDWLEKISEKQLSEHRPLPELVNLLTYNIDTSQD